MATVEELEARIEELEFAINWMQPLFDVMIDNYVGWDQVELSGQMQLLKYNPPPEAPGV